MPSLLVEQRRRARARASSPGGRGCSASSCAACSASWALMVSLSSRILPDSEAKHRRRRDKSGGARPDRRLTDEARERQWARRAVRSRFRRMSYLVLARKYRPQRFAELVGQEHVARTLRTPSRRTASTTRSCSRARAASARPARRASWPRRCRCEKGPTAEPCGDVRPLPGDRRRALGRRHRDRRARRTPSVEETKSLLEGVRYLPARARRKVYIIDEVHMLSAQRVQRAAQDAGGAAAARGVRLRDDRGAQDPGHHPVALPALRLQADPDGAAGRAPRRHPRAPRRSRPTPDAVRLIARQAAGSVRDGLSLLDQVDRLRRRPSADRRGDAPRCWASPIAGCSSSWPAPRWTATRARRCAWSRAPPIAGVDFGELGAGVPGLPARPRGDRPGDGRGGPTWPIWSTPRPTRSRRRARSRARRRRRGCSRCCSIAGRAPSTRRRACQTPRLLLEMAARRPVRGGAAGAARRSAAAAGRAGGAAAAAAPRAPRAGGRARRLRPAGARQPADAARPGPRSCGARRRPPRPPSSRRRRPAGRARRRPAPAVRRRPRRPATSARPWRRVTAALRGEAAAAGGAARARRGGVAVGGGERRRSPSPSKLRRRSAEKARAEIEQALSATLGRPAQGGGHRRRAGAAAAVLRSEVGAEADAANADRKNREAEARQHPDHPAGAGRVRRRR